MPKTAPANAGHQRTSSAQTGSSSTSGKSTRAGKGGNRNQPIVSCLECRRMKWKCDRQFPCSNCRKRGIQELCPNGRLPPIRGSHELLASTVSMQERMKELEAELEQARRVLASNGLTLGSDGGRTPRDSQEHWQRPVADSGPRSSASHPQPQPHAYDLEVREHWNENRQPASTHLARTVPPEHVSQMPVNDPDPGAHLAADDGQLVVGNEPGTGTFFGQAGAQYLMVVEPEPAERPNSSDPWAGSHKGSPRDNAVLDDLPPKDVAIRWADIYFWEASFMNHILDRSEFDYLLEKAYSYDAHVHGRGNHQLAVMFMVLAIGASMDFNMSPYNEPSRRLQAAACACLDIGNYLHGSDEVSISLVQAIHLMSRYLVNSAHGPSASKNFWTTLGMAVRSAQSMGLHRDGEKWGLDSEDVELRRRVFWEIHTEDILQSMTQGRPRLVPDSIMDCRLPSFSPKTLSEVFHNIKYRVARIFARINDHQTSTSPVPYSAVLAAHRDLQAVEASLPVDLVTPSNEQPRDRVDRKLQWQLLYLRLMIQEGYVFLHRAHFALCLRDRPGEPLSSAFRFSYVSELEASRVILEIYLEALALDPRIATRFWIFFFHAFTAIVNFAGVVIRSPASSLAPAALSHAENAVAVISGLEKGSRPRDELATLQRVLEQARQAFALQTDTSPSKSTEILGIGQRLVRLPPKPSGQPPMRQGVAQQHPRFPTTLAEAVAEHPQDNMAWVAFEESSLPTSTGPTSTTHDMLDLFLPPTEGDFQAFLASIGLGPEGEAGL